MAQLLFEKGDRREAKEAFEALLVEYRTMDRPKAIAEVLVLLSRFHQGSTGLDNQACEYLQEAIHIYSRLDNDFELRACRSLLGAT